MLGFEDSEQEELERIVTRCYSPLINVLAYYLLSSHSLIFFFPLRNPWIELEWLFSIWLASGGYSNDTAAQYQSFFFKFKL